MKEKITAIVTVYNRFEYVRNMIISLKKQTKQIDELILADDGSKEELFPVIEDLLTDCNFTIKHVIQEDLAFRLSRSRNNGVRVSSGDFLIFMDQDLIFPNDFIEKVYNARQKNKMLISVAIYSSEDEKNKIEAKIENDSYENIFKYISKDKIDKAEKKIRKHKLNNILYALKLRTRGMKMKGYFFALYKEDFIKLNGFDEKYIGWGEEDDDFCNRFYKMGGTLKCIEPSNFLIHMYHYSAPSKKESPNIDYYRLRKKEISKKNYKSYYGYNNTLGDDKYIAKNIK